MELEKSSVKIILRISEIGVSPSFTSCISMLPNPIGQCIERDWFEDVDLCETETMQKPVQKLLIKTYLFIFSNGKLCLVKLSSL